jgi:hypothetical protein
MASIIGCNANDTSGSGLDNGTGIGGKGNWKWPDQTWQYGALLWRQTNKV